MSSGPRVPGSASKVYRLVTEKPERVSLKILTALCDIFDCTPADLIEPYVETAGRKQKVQGATVIDVSPNLRPKRARILDEP